MASPAAKRAFPVTVEAKKTAADPGRKAMKQAQYNAVKGTIGAVVWQTTGEGGSKGEIRFDLGEFIDWFKKFYAHERMLLDTCSRCFGSGLVYTADGEDEFGRRKSLNLPCGKCKGSGKTKDSDNVKR